MQNDDDDSNEQQVENESESEEPIIINESESEEEEEEAQPPKVNTINPTEPPLKEDKDTNRINTTNPTLLYTKDDKETKSAMKDLTGREQQNSNSKPTEIKERQTPIQVPAIQSIPQPKPKQNQYQHHQSPSSQSNLSKDQQQLTKSPQSINDNNYKEKTIFTKLSEQMYKQMMSSNSKGKDIYSYDAFIKDEYLSAYSEKFNRGNNVIIKEFVERSTKVSQKKRMGINGNAKGNSSTRTKNTSSYAYTDKEKDKEKELLAIQEKQRKNIKTPRSNKQFITDQDAHNKKRQAKLNELKDKYTQEKEKLSYPVPLIDSNSIEINNKKRSNSAQKDYNVHNKLYEENYRKKKEYALKNNINIKSRSSSVNKREAQGNINRLVNKLYNDARERCKKTKENERSKSRKEYKLNPRDLASNTSNKLIMKKLIEEYDSALNHLFQVKKEDNINITYNGFVGILYEMRFTMKNFAHCNQSLEKEYQLTKDAWKVLTRKKDHVNDMKIPSHFILLFLLNVCNLYKGKDIMLEVIESVDNQNLNKKNINDPLTSKEKPSLIKKNLPFINEDEYFFEPQLSNQIAIFFRLLNDNRRNNQLLQKDMVKSTKMSRNDQRNRAECTFKPRTNSHKKYLADRYLHKMQSENNLTNTKKLTLCDTYNVIQLKRERTLQQLRKEKTKELLKECTFYPNNKSPLSRSVSAEVSNRLYTKGRIKQPMSKPKLNISDENDSDSKSNENECTFTPQLTDYNQAIFKTNPIKKDYLVQNGIDRYEKARIDRKMKDYLLSQGYHSLNKLRTSEDVIRDMTRSEMTKDFHFELEKKNNKDTFERYNSSKQFKPNKSKHLLFTFEIKIDDKVKTLLYYQGDNIIAKADAFCKENNLPHDSKEQIIAAMKVKVNSKR